MSDITNNQIQAYVETLKTVTIPQIQMQFNLSYDSAHRVIDNLIDDGAVEFNSDITYNVVSENMRAAKEPEKTEEEKLKEARECLERRKAEILARMQAQLEYEDEEDCDEEDEDEDEEDDKIASPEMIKVLELGIRRREEGKPSISIPIIQQELGFERELATKTYDELKNKYYLSADHKNPQHAKVNISRAALEKIKEYCNYVDDEKCSTNTKTKGEDLASHMDELFNKNSILTGRIIPFTKESFNKLHKIYNENVYLEKTDNHITMTSDIQLIDDIIYTVNIYRTKEGFYLSDEGILMEKCIDKVQYERAIRSIDFYGALESFGVILYRNKNLYISVNSLQDVWNAYIKLYAAIECAIKTL